MTTINLSVKRPKADGRPGEGFRRVLAGAPTIRRPGLFPFVMRGFAPWDAAMNGNPANPVLTAHLTAGRYTLKIRASSGKTYANAHLGVRLHKTN